MSLDKKLKWKQSFQKSLSQSSLNSQRKASLLEEETSDQELQEYLESLKKKSGIRGLWSGEKFEKAVRDDEDKTPDISISSSENELGESFHSDVKQDDDSDDDFKPNIVMLPTELLSDPKEDQISDLSSGELFHGIQLANFDLSDGETKEDLKSVSLNNDDPSQSKSVTISEPKDINAIMNNLHLASEIETEDEVAEEIEDDVDIAEIIPSTARKDSPDYSSFQSSPEPNHTPRESTPSGKRSRNRPSRTKSATSIEQSYSMDFSTADEASVVTEKTESFTQDSRSSKSSHSSRTSHRSSRSSHRSSRLSNRSSRSALSSRSTHISRSKPRESLNSEHSFEKPKSPRDSKSKTNKVLKDKNSYLCDVGVQTGLDLEGLTVPSGLGIGMATAGQSIGMQYVDPSPIATHVVSAEALEAVTAYNPALVALTDMLKQQIRLVQQFVDANNRMYQAYASGINTQYRYTTLEDTLEFIEKNKPRTLSLKQALQQVKDEET